MAQKRNRYELGFKLKAVIEALEERETLGAIAAKYEVSSAMISKWRDEFKTDPVAFYENKTKKQIEKTRKQEEREQKLMATIGQLTVEVDFLKKKSKEFGIL